MAKTLNVVFDGEVLRPEELSDLEPNARYVVTIKKKKVSKEKSLWDTLSDLTGTTEGPVDWSQEHDHYLYDVPKNKKNMKL